MSSVDKYLKGYRKSRKIHHSFLTVSVNLFSRIWKKSLWPGSWAI